MSNPIFSLFASSPFLPMQEHMKKVLECVQTLEGFMLAVFDEDWEQAENISKPSTIWKRSPTTSNAKYV